MGDKGKRNASPLDRPEHPMSESGRFLKRKYSAYLLGMVDKRTNVCYDGAVK